MLWGNPFPKYSYLLSAHRHLFRLLEYAKRHQSLAGERSNSINTKSLYEGQNSLRQLLIAAFDLTDEKTKTKLEINSNLSPK